MPTPRLRQRVRRADEAPAFEELDKLDQLQVMRRAEYPDDSKLDLPLFSRPEWTPRTWLASPQGQAAIKDWPFLALERQGKKMTAKEVAAYRRAHDFDGPWMKEQLRKENARHVAMKAWAEKANRARVEADKARLCAVKTEGDPS